MTDFAHGGHQTTIYSPQRKVFRPEKRQDPYPTRKVETERRVPRRDPVVARGAETAAGPLDADQVRAFDRDGFLVLQEIFEPSEVDDLRSEAAAMARAAIVDVDDREDVILEPGGTAIRSIFDIHRNNEMMRRLAADPRIADAIRQLLGTDVYIHQSRINYKPGFSGKMFQWHSDFETWHAEDGMPRMRAISCSIALSDNHTWNGTLMLVPGSHRTFVCVPGETPDRNYEKSLRKQKTGVPSKSAVSDLVDDGGIVQFTGPAGSVLLFECNTLHGSPGNMTPHPRDNLFYVYNSVDNALVEPFAANEPRPEFIAGRNPQPISEW